MGCPDGIRASPRDGPGTYFVGKDEWKVGARYQVQKLLGSGSFSSVCCCLDMLTGEHVAIKRIPDVLASPEQAKRVLREVAILRRLQHDNVIGLHDAFTQPSSTGGFRFVGGQLVPASIDAYLVMEWADGGDLFGLRGQLAAGEVRMLMRQLLEALAYLHSQSVWHRDLKSSNVLLSHQTVEGEDGRPVGRQRVIKVADLGSARSAVSEGYSHVEQRPPAAEAAARRGAPVQALSAAAAHPAHMPGTSPQDGGKVLLQDLYVQIGNRAGPGACGLTSPLTRMVATPCYRAPEVVMSRGGYTSAIDMWSAGCIFGELLQRVTYVGSAATPQLQVAPLFAIHGMPKTPGSGDKFDGVSDRVTRQELKALFDVIGTPSWVDAENVPTPAWRNYLQNLPGRAPKLYRRLGAAGEPAVHLLSRLLTFDPAHRATAAEALCHEYFAGDDASFGQTATRQPVKPVAHADTPSGPLPAPSGALAAGIQTMDIEDRRRKDSGLRSPQRTASKKARFQLDDECMFDSDMDVASDDEPLRPGSAVLNRTSVEASMNANNGATAFEAATSEPLQGGEGGGVLVEPAEALAAIEAETGDVALGSSTHALARLRSLLEREIEAQHSVSLTREAPPTPASPDMRRQLRHRHTTDLSGYQGGSSAEAPSEGMNGSAQQRPRHRSFSEIPSWEGLQEDAGAGGNEIEYGRGRLANVADAGQGKLDPAEFMSRGRHGDWPVSSSGLGPKAGPAWGVSSTPPGFDLSDTKMKAAIQAQQRR
mmetsp:Transcript_20906/g.62924  ORF Transcript_20906/g.62924 Transcript_20906/m.62924 type:complete len:762 (-) Transcript_20906:527-2812(-)